MTGATVFVFATEAEARPLLDTFGQARLRDSLLPLYGVGDALLLVCGSGPSAAAAAIERLAADYKPRRVVLGGVARRLHERLPVGAIAHIGVASFERPLRATYAPLARILTHQQIGQHADCILVSCATAPEDDSGRAHLAAGADLLDGEGAAVAHACVTHAIECAIFKAIGAAAGEPALSAGLSAELNTRLAAFLLRHYAILTAATQGQDAFHGTLVAVS